MTTSVPARKAGGLSKIRVTPLGEALGAEVDAGDLNQVSSEAFREIHAAWLQFHVLRFRGVTFDDEGFDRFSRRFGPPQPTQMSAHVATRTDLGSSGTPSVRQAARSERFPHIAVVSNVIESGVALGGLGDGELMWHSDQSNHEAPPSATLLHAIEAPSGQGRTGFVNAQMAWERLPHDLRKRVKNLQLKHDGSLDAAGYRRPDHVAVADVRTSPGQPHPLVCIHPESGRECLFLGRRPNSYLLGLSVADSDALLNQLWTHVTQEQFIWRQDWRPGDVVVWDNRSVLHQREGFDPTARRILRRIMTQGTKPAAAASTPVAQPT
jgi:taurine dioxygenase